MKKPVRRKKATPPPAPVVEPVVITVADPDDEEGFHALAEFLLPMAEEVGMAPVDPDSALDNGWRAVDQGMTFVAKRGEAIVGTLAMIRVPYWYADPKLYSFLVDQWFFVAPDERFGSVGVKLLRAAREAAKEADIRAFIRIVNPHRRPAATDAGAFAVIAGFDPFAKFLQIA